MYDYDRADEAVENLTTAAYEATLQNDWDAVFTIRVRTSGGNGFSFEVYVSDEAMESDPMFESREYMTHDDAWGVIGDLESLFGGAGRLSLSDVAAHIGHVSGVKR